MKKMKEKYKDQDEEDRELIMKLLGVSQNNYGFSFVLFVLCLSVGLNHFHMWNLVCRVKQRRKSEER